MSITKNINKHRNRIGEIYVYEQFQNSRITLDESNE